MTMVPFFGMAPMAGLATILVIIAVVLLFTLLLQWLWNITMPQVFNLREVTFWQAFRLLLIAGILFGGTNFSS